MKNVGKGSQKRLPKGVKGGEKPTSGSQKAAKGWPSKCNKHAKITGKKHLKKPIPKELGTTYHYNDARGGEP